MKQRIYLQTWIRVVYEDASGCSNRKLYSSRLNHNLHITKKQEGSRCQPEDFSVILLSFALFRMPVFFSSGPPSWLRNGGNQSLGHHNCLLFISVSGVGNFMPNQEIQTLPCCPPCSTYVTCLPRDS